MTAIALLVTWWAGVGVVVGLSRASMYPGPQTALRWAAIWAVGWPLLWLTEDRA